MDKEFWIQLGITAVLQALNDAMRSAGKREALRSAMMKIASTIQGIYAWNDDATFNDDWDDELKVKSGRIADKRLGITR